MLCIVWLKWKIFTQKFTVELLFVKTSVKRSILIKKPSHPELVTEPHSDLCILLMIEGRKVLQKAEDRIKGVWMSREAEEDLDVEKYLITDGVLK